MSDDFEPDATSRILAGWRHIDTIALSLLLWVGIVMLVRWL